MEANMKKERLITKGISLFLILVLVLGISACSKNENQNSLDRENTKETNDKNEPIDNAKVEKDNAKDKEDNVQVKKE